jgi:zinc protease
MNRNHRLVGGLAPLLILLLVVTLPAPAAVASAEAVSAPPAPVSAAPAGALKLPPYKQAVLGNGLTLLLMEQHEVPLVSLHVLVRAGSVGDPAGREGVASLTAALLRKGTATRSADRFSEDLDFIGGSFDAGVSVDATTISAEFMKKDLARGLDLVADALLRPTFPADEVGKLVRQRVDGIKSAKDRAQGVLPTYFNAYLYGAHPYGRPAGGDETSLAAITRDDVAKYYAASYVPAATVIAVVGDFVTADMERDLGALFGAWPAKAATAVPLADAVTVAGRKLLLVDKPDATQTYFCIGNVGINRTNPDRVVIEVVNTLFGGRFTSMINTELRIKSGLTYGARAAFTRWSARGPFLISSYTRNSSTVTALDLALEVLQRLHEKGISEADLASSKAYLKGQFPPSIESDGQLAGVLADLAFNGLDEREIDGYFAKIDAVTMADVNRVIREYYPLENLVFTLIGKASEIEGGVAKYAPVTDRKSISAPGF